MQALIIPDITIEEYNNYYKKLYNKYELSNIFLITPQTSEERIRQIDKLSNTFIYTVSSSSITGAKGEITDEQKEYFTRINNMNLKNPHLIGFGISNNKTFKIACKNSSGAIIGSAFINKISESGDLKVLINEFIKNIQA